MVDEMYRESRVLLKMIKFIDDVKPQLSAAGT